MTVYARKVASTPARAPAETWTAIRDMLGAPGDVAKSFDRVAGVLASVIADQYPKDDPITIVGEGPRVRVYCLFGDAALGDEANEAGVHEKLLQGDWMVYVPVGPKDFAWIVQALKPHPHFLAYDPKVGPPKDAAEAGTPAVAMTVNKETWANL